MNIFKKKVDPKEALRTSKREMSVATRGVEREIGSLQMEEKKLVAEIKKTAKTGNEAATKILARQLVRLRQQIVNLQGTRAQIRGVATHTQAMYAGTSISAGMKGASKAMAAMNKQMEPTKQMKQMREFQKQSSQLDMTLEMMSDAIDETLDKDEAEEETEELTNQVLDEIGVDVASQLSSAPKGRIGASNKKAENNQARPSGLTVIHPLYYSTSMATEDSTQLPFPTSTCPIEQLDFTTFLATHHLINTLWMYMGEYIIVTHYFSCRYLCDANVNGGDPRLRLHDYNNYIFVQLLSDPNKHIGHLSLSIAPRLAIALEYSQKYKTLNMHSLLLTFENSARKLMFPCGVTVKDGGSTEDQRPVRTWGEAWGAAQ
ncbi:hypothetical protein VPH35_099754 [Triticum aestivum]